MSRGKCLASRVVLSLTASALVVASSIAPTAASPLDFFTPPATAPAAPPAPPPPAPATRPTTTATTAPATQPIAKGTPEQINDAIKKGIAYLYSRQKDGHWEGSTTAYGQNQYTGLTALATYALLASGERSTDPRIIESMTFLKKNPARGVYALGLRAQVWASLSQPRDFRQAMVNDKMALTSAMRTTGRSAGLFHYFNDQGDSYDHSAAQFGVLGLWAIERAGIECDTKLWKLADAAWHKHQQADGSWGYVNGEDNKAERPSLSMTAAGVASLFITQEQIRNPVGCTGSTADPAIDRGIDWIGQRYDQLFNDQSQLETVYYTLFGMSRIGIISGRKFFGKHDWFAEGADWLLERQRKDGAWGPPGAEDSIVATSFALLFLARGSAPVLIQKLQYQTAAGTEGPWAQRPRDIANVTAWMGREMERNFNWQSTPLEATSATLQDAPILYISGSAPPVFSSEEIARLRDYVQSGGVILGHADCGSQEFATAFRNLGAELFPAYQFRELPASHPIYTSETVQYKAAKWVNRPRLEGLSNGVRELMILLPTSDVAKAWQMNDTEHRQEFFQIASNIVLYATDNRPMAKGMTHLVTPDPGKPIERNISVARLSYDGNWDPEPGGWKRLAAVMQNRAKSYVKIAPVKLGEKQLRNFKVAHLTGTDKIALSFEQRDELKDFFRAGGTLIIDAAGGSPDFTTAMDDELSTMFPGKDIKMLEPIPPEHPSMGGVQEVSYRFWARSRNQIRTDKPQIRGYELDGRVIVFLSSVDLTGGLVGQNVDGIPGYSPASATGLMESMLLYAARSQPQPATTQAATTQAVTRPSP